MSLSQPFQSLFNTFFLWKPQSPDLPKMSRPPIFICLSLLFPQTFVLICSHTKIERMLGPICFHPESLLLCNLDLFCLTVVTCGWIVCTPQCCSICLLRAVPSPTTSLSHLCSWHSSHPISSHSMLVSQASPSFVFQDS